MSTVSRGLPAQPHPDVPKQQARELLRQCKAHVTEALDRVRRRHPRFQSADDDAIASTLKLSDSQLVIAREYGFSSWTQLKLRITGNTAAQLIDKAIKTIAALGAKDFQHALGRALLHGDIDIAKWLHQQGAEFTPGSNHDY